MMMSNMVHKCASSQTPGHFQAQFGNEEGLFLGLVCFDYSREDDFVSELIRHLNEWVESVAQRSMALRLIFSASLDSSGHQMSSLMIDVDGSIRPLFANSLVDYVGTLDENSFVGHIRPENIRSDDSSHLEL